jgi:hypothetical protein
VKLECKVLKGFWHEIYFRFFHESAKFRNNFKWPQYDIRAREKLIREENLKSKLSCQSLYGVKLKYKVLWSKVVKSQGKKLEYIFLEYATGMQSFEMRSWNKKF